MLRVWGRANSSNVMKVIWLLESLALPYERIDVGGPFGKTDTQDYRAMNPTGLVPTLQDGDFTLWESNAILRYICNAYASQTTLYPTEIQTRARIDRWMDFQQTTFGPPMTTVFIGLIRTPEPQRNPAAIAAAITALTRILAIIEAELATHPNMVGDTLTLADIVLGIFIHRWFTLPIERAEFPALKRWYDSLLQLPIYRKHIAIPLS